MKVAFFLSDFPIYYLSWLCNIADGLAARGFEIHLYLQKAGAKIPIFHRNVKVINLSEPGLNHSSEQVRCVDFHNIPFSYLLPPLSILIVRDMSARERYNYCIGFESAGLLLAKIAADASGCPFAYLSFELHGDQDLGVWGDQVSDFKKFESILMPEIDLFIIQGQTRCGEYFKILNTGRRPQNTMYFPISLPRVSLKEEPRYWHNKYNLSESLKIVFYIGQICSNRFVDKMVMSAQSFDAGQLLVVHGPAFDYVHDTLKEFNELDRKNRVIFSIDEVGPDKIKYMAASADIGLALYKREPINDFTTGKSSDKMAQYMQAGIPVVCSKYPTFEEVVNEYHNGECLSDFAELPLLVNRIFDNYSYYSEGARNAFEDIYNADKHLDVLSDHIRSRGAVRPITSLIGASANNVKKTREKETPNNLLGRKEGLRTDLGEKLFRKGFQHLREGNVLEAVKYFDEAAENCPALPNLHFARATALAQIGKLGLAKEACQAELMWRPENSNARGFLERIEKTIGELAENRGRQLQSNPARATHRYIADGYTSGANQRSTTSSFVPKATSQSIQENNGKTQGYLRETLNAEKNDRWFEKEDLKVVIGSGDRHIEGWISTDIDTLNILDRRDWDSLFRKNSISNILSEHVLEHLTRDEVKRTLSLCYEYLKVGGKIRIAVPDAYRRDEKYVKWVLPPKDGHKTYWNYKELKNVMEETGFKVELLEYFDENEEFRFVNWDEKDGIIFRSKKYDKRENFKRGDLCYTSLIVDGIKSALRAFGSLKPQGPKFSFVMIVLNGMPFIEYSLKSVYDFAHEIIIVEGAVEKCMFAANPDGSSKDGTVEFIKSFPDPAGKIKLLQGRWPEKREMQNEALKYVTGNYVWLIDSDEVYKKEDLEKIKKILINAPSITQVNFIPDNFWKGLDYIFVSSKFFEPSGHYRRLFKYVPGAVFTSHRPPAMVWPDSERTTEHMHLLDGSTTRQMEIIIYHYSYVLDEQVEQKVELYQRYGWGNDWSIDLHQWYNECFRKWTPEDRQAIEEQYPVAGDSNSRTWLFNGTHPDVMRPFIEKFKTSLLKPQTSKNIKITSHYQGNHDLAKISGESDFSHRIRDLIRTIRPNKIIETGTYLGTGTTRIIASALEEYGIHDACFYSIEVNPGHYVQAEANIGSQSFKKYVRLLHGLSVPRKKLPSRDEIEDKCVKNVEFDDIFVDHEEQTRVQLYFQETDFPQLADDLLGACLEKFDYRPNFVILDSAGHMGFIEFEYLISQLKGWCYIALDNIYHIKHHKSFRVMQEDTRFDILCSSQEKFGFCIARFTPRLDVEAQQRYMQGQTSDGLPLTTGVGILNCPQPQAIMQKNQALTQPHQLPVTADLSVKSGSLTGIGRGDENRGKEIMNCSKASFGLETSNNQVIPVSAQLCENLQSSEGSLPLTAVENAGKNHYGQEYFDWQKNIGSFGGIANLFKFADYIRPDFSVVDFGCGGGYLLRNIKCKQKMGIEVNAYARQEAKNSGIKAVESIGEVPDNHADIVISNHTLEHVENPVGVLRALKDKLKDNGKIVFVVPHQDIRERYDPDDINKHLYTWNQLTLGNLFSVAGYKVLRVEAFQHQWPPGYLEIYSQYGEEEFHRRCREYAVKNNNYQIRIIAAKT